MKKRSVTIAGHRTSLTLEEPFWAELQAMAQSQGRPLSALVTEIDKNRDLRVNLSSALRLYVLAGLQKRLGVNADHSAGSAASGSPTA